MGVQALLFLSLCPVWHYVIGSNITILVILTLLVIGNISRLIVTLYAARPFLTILVIGNISRLIVTLYTALPFLNILLIATIFQLIVLSIKRKRLGPVRQVRRFAIHLIRKILDLSRGWVGARGEHSLYIPLFFQWWTIS